MPNCSFIVHSRASARPILRICFENVTLPLRSMQASAPSVKSSGKSFRRHQRQKARSFQSRTLAEWTNENALYEVEFSNGRGRQIALRRNDAWFDRHGTRVGVSEEVQAIYFPARQE